MTLTHRNPTPTPSPTHAPRSKPRHADRSARTGHGLAGLALAFALLGPAARAAEPAGWPQFRGPGGQGHSDVKGLPLEWAEDRNVTWRTPLPGQGWSSPVVEDGKVWLTAAVTLPATAEDRARRLKQNTGNQPLNVAKAVLFHALCVDLATGRLEHDIELFREDEPQWVHQLNSYASPTPVLHRGRLYCHFGAFGNACVDTQTAKLVWTQRELRVNHENGPGSTPVLHNQKLIFHLDGSDTQSIAALDASTGQLAWRTPRTGKMRDDPQLKKAYGTPLIVDYRGKPALISPAADWVYAYDPDTGEELWKLSYGVLGFSTVPKPVAGHGMVYLATSFLKSELLAIRIDGQGDKPEPHIAWRMNKGAPQMPSPLLVGDEVYVISDQGGIVTCCDARTGAILYRERIEGNYSASPLYADGRIHFFSREGLTTVLKPGRTFEVLAKNKLDGSLMASPAVAHGALLLRTDKALYRIELKKG